MRKWTSRAVFSLLVFCLAVLAVLMPRGALAHCDGWDGPVVKAAKKALETGNINLVLIWVQKDDEAAIRDAFKKASDVRKLSPDAKELADLHLFETLVRLHRAGEKAPYTGLKPAGRDLGPAIPAADKAIEDGNSDPLSKLLTDSVREGLLKSYREVMERKDFDKNDVEKGREYVRAYVEFVHYVERLHEAASQPAHGHAPEAPGSDIHD